MKASRSGITSDTVSSNGVVHFDDGSTQATYAMNRAAATVAVCAGLGWDTIPFRY
jgi:hypothetical protein